MENIPLGFFIIIGTFILVVGSQKFKDWLNSRMRGQK